MAARNRPRQRVVHLDDLRGFDDERGERDLDVDHVERGGASRAVAALSRPHEPIGGMRVAYSYLVGVLAGLIGGGVGWAIAAQLYQTHTVCATDDSLTCPFATFLVVALVLLGAALGVGTWWARLGGLWWLVSVALSLLLFEVVGDPSSPLLLAIVLVPLAAALITDPTRRGMSRRRAWITGGVAAGAILQFLAAAWMALR